MVTRELIIPNGMETIYDQKLYAPGVRVGNLLFVSGMLGRDADLNVIHETEAQFVQLFENMNMVLEAGGASFDSIIELVGYFVEMQRDFVIYQAVRDHYIHADFPAQTAIGVKELSTPGLLLELKCVALVDNKD
jgi:enamine deaminase RidA (YjgF/YER057c/UK114 family)